MNKNIVLIGFMGCGKTTVGRVLAKELGYDFIDTDDLVEKEEETTITKLFETKGEEYFRKAETSALRKSIALDKCVISTGGGIVTIKDNNVYLNKGIVVYLKATPQQIYDNVKGDTSRPLLQGEDVRGKIRSMLEDREILYKEAADYTICVDGKTPQQICNVLLRGIK